MLFDPTKIAFLIQRSTTPLRQTLQFPRSNHSGIKSKIDQRTLAQLDLDFGPRSVHFEEPRKGETKRYREGQDRISTMAVICIKAEERADATLVPLVVIE